MYINCRDDMVVANIKSNGSDSLEAVFKPLFRVQEQSPSRLPDSTHSSAIVELPGRAIQGRESAVPDLVEKLAPGVKNHGRPACYRSIDSKSGNAFAKASLGTTARVGTNRCLQPALPRAGLRWPRAAS